MPVDVAHLDLFGEAAALANVILIDVLLAGDNAVVVGMAAAGVAQANRLLNRAGFGPAPGEAEALVAMGMVGAVQSLTRPSGAATGLASRCLRRRTICSWSAGTRR